MEIVMAMVAMMAIMMGGMLGFHKMMGGDDHGKHEEVKQEKVLPEMATDTPPIENDHPARAMHEKADRPAQNDK